MLEKEKLEQEMNNAIKWIKQYVQNAGANGVIIGNSGGKDSATVLAMASKAIGKEKILAVSMPCNSQNSDIEDAELVAKNFGVKNIKVDLSNTYNGMEREINLKLDQNLSKESTINIKPRLRMTTLYGIAQTLGYLVIGTGSTEEKAKEEIIKRYKSSKHKRSLVAVYTFERRNLLKEKE